ncbi:hypothetical protein ADK58_21920 [Streptomyces sp. XY152]|nr:hypothetical protein ADK58_21920 [Streptomyces sp. XY152]
MTDAQELFGGDHRTDRERAAASAGIDFVTLEEGLSPRISRGPRTCASRRRAPKGTLLRVGEQADGGTGEAAAAGDAFTRTGLETVRIPSTTGSSAVAPASPSHSTRLPARRGSLRPRANPWFPTWSIQPLRTAGALCRYIGKTATTPASRMRRTWACASSEYAFSLSPRSGRCDASGIRFPDGRGAFPGVAVWCGARSELLSGFLKSRPRSPGPARTV